MEDLVSTALSFVAIAAFIAFRLVASGKKKAEAADRTRFAQSVAAAAKKEPVMSAIAFADYEEAAVPARASGGDAARNQADVDSWRIPVSPPGKIAAKAAQPPTALAPLARLDRLSPLRRAVVLAEVLGQPKGLRNGW